MQVFKSYFKILNKKKGSMLMYIGIFAGIMIIRKKVKNCFRIWIMHINMLN